MGQPLSTTGLTGWEPPAGQAWGLLCPRLAPSEAGQGLPPAPHPSGRSAPAGPSPVLCSSGLAQIGPDRRRSASARAAEFCRVLFLAGPADVCSPSAHSGAEQGDSFYVRLCDWLWILSHPYTPCGQRPWSGLLPEQRPHTGPGPGWTLHKWGWGEGE